MAEQAENNENIASELQNTDGALQTRGAIRVSYDGGSIPGVKAGAHLKLYNIDRRSELRARCSSTTRRGNWSRSGVTWHQRTNGVKQVEETLYRFYLGRQREKGGAAFQADKGEYRGVLAGLEGVTGGLCTRIYLLCLTLVDAL